MTPTPHETLLSYEIHEGKVQLVVMHGVKEKIIINTDDPCSEWGKKYGATKCALASRANRPADSARLWLRKRSER